MTKIEKKNLKFLRQEDINENLLKRVEELEAERRQYEDLKRKKHDS